MYWGVIIFVIFFYIALMFKLKLPLEHSTFWWTFISVFAVMYYIFSFNHYVEIEYNEPNPFEYAHITELDFKATLHDSPSEGNYLDVKEIINFDIRSKDKENLCVELWRGLEEYKADGLTTNYNIKSVKQIMKNGEVIEYEQSPRIYVSESDYTDSLYGPQKWFHSKGPYNAYTNSYECLMIYPDPTYRDNLQFEIDYEVYDCTYKYKDCSEIYFQVFNTDATKYIKKLDFEFLVPNDLMPKKKNYYFKFNGTDDIVVKHSVDNEINPGYYTFSVHKNENDLKFGFYNRFLEFLIVSYNEDKDIISSNAPDNRYSMYNMLEVLQEEQIRYEYNLGFKYFKIIAFCICVIGSIGVVIYTKQTLNKGVKGEGAMTKPKLDYDYYATVPEKLDLHIASGLFHCKNKENLNPIEYSFPAILLSLANKGFIKIENDTLTRLQDYCVSKYNASTLNVVDDKTKELYDESITPSEERVFNIIKRYTFYNPSIKISGLFNKLRYDYYNTCSFCDDMDRLVQDYGYNHGLFSKPKYKEYQDRIIQISKYMMKYGLVLLVIFNLLSLFTHIGFIYGGYTILGLTLIICSIYLSKRSSDFVLLTEKGELEYQKWHAYYNYLKNDNLYHETDREDLNNYDDCLLYAIALGLPEKKIDKLKTKFPNTFRIQDDLNNVSYIGGHYHHFYRYRTRMHRSTTGARSSLNTLGSYGSSSYSRGGRGGGGGF